MDTEELAEKLLQRFGSGVSVETSEDDVVLAETSGLDRRVVEYTADERLIGVTDGGYFLLLEDASPLDAIISAMEDGQVSDRYATRVEPA